MESKRYYCAISNAVLGGYREEEYFDRYEDAKKWCMDMRKKYDNDYRISLNDFGKMNEVVEKREHDGKKYTMFEAIGLDVDIDVEEF